MTAFVGPLRNSPIVERLQSQVPAFRIVGGAADMETAYEEASPTTPAGYVLLATTDPRPPKGSTMRLVQPATNSFGVALAIRDYRYSDGGAGDETILFIQSVRAALLGWVHPDVQGATVRLGGRCGVLKYRNAVLWWQETYAADFSIRTK